MTIQKLTAIDWLIGGGEMGQLIRSMDWSTTPLGAIESWSQSLRTAASICLNSRFPMVIWWGPDLILLYNDAWQPILGNKHPTALGRPGREVWTEVWEIVGAQLQSVLSTGQATWSDDLMLPAFRYGYLEEAYFTYSYSPIFIEDGSIGGAFTAVAETTQRVLGERRMVTLRLLAAQAGEAKTIEQACKITLQTIAENPQDIPFAALYRLNADQTAAVLQATTLPDTSIAVPTQVSLAPTQLHPWLFSSVVQHQQPVLVDIADIIGSIPAGVLSVPLQQALLLPVLASGQEEIVGILVVGVNPGRILDDDYRNFFKMVTGHIATAIANANTYEEEHKRAEALAEIDRAKTAFFSNVSHEFRTPLTLMLAPLEDTIANLDGTIPPQEREQLQLIQRNGMRLLKLVNSLLDFSRIEAGRVQVSYELIDLASYTAELASTFRTLIERVGMSLVVECPTLPEAIYVDREMWEKIVLNLLSNAFKFTLAGTITVGLQWLEKSVELTVSDTGVGIPPEELLHLFERFHRVKNSQGRSFEGSGIGLSLVQELVKLHGGAIKVSSTSGQGSCFSVTIPTGTAHLPKERIGASRTLASTTLGAMPYVEEAQRWLSSAAKNGELGVPSGDKGEWALDKGDTQIAPAPYSLLPTSTPAARILLVDDNADMRGYVKRLLSQQYEVEAVTDGVAALAAVRQQLPDLVLTDVMMPELDGFGLLRELRADPQTMELPIILLSARAGEESRIEGLEAGADDYLIKPFSARELLARVEANLKMAQLRQEATRREQAQRQEAEAAKEQLKSVLSSINDQFLVLDRERRYIYVNDRVVETVGMPTEALLGKSIWEVFPELVGSEFDTQLQQAMAEQMPVHFEYFYPTWNRWFENHVYPSPDGLTIFATEITDRKRADKRLHLLYETTRDLLATEHPLLLMSNLFSKLSVQLELHDYYNYMVEEKDNRLMMHLRNYQGISHEAAQSIEWIEFGQYMCGLVAQEHRQIVLDQKQISTHPNAQLICSIGITAYAGQPLIVKGQLLGTLAFCSRTRTCFTPEEIDLLQSNCEQMSIALERANLLTSIQQQAEQLQQANQIKDEFLAVLSHELRSPLNPILGWSKLLQTRKLDKAKTAQALSVIERNAKLQSELIEDLLDVSRILQGKLSLNSYPVNLISVIQGGLETVRLAAEAKSIQIQATLEPNVGQVSGDPNRLQQVIWNLLSNAVKFTDAGGRVDIRLERLGCVAQISISDTGKGIHPDFLPNVFDYFRQQDGATTRRFGGLGLGLAIVRHLVELHGGTVQAESPGEGQGATFTVKLPLMPSPPQISPDNKPSAPSLDLQGIKILVVDDDADTREFIVFLLQMYGANVTAVASAVEALAIFTQYRADVLLSDIGMPEVDGYMLVREVRALPHQQCGQIPAIALTAYAGEINYQKAMEAGFQRHIPKPIDSAKLVEAITDLVKHR
jgi:PAS domain S-box-containing protein